MGPKHPCQGQAWFLSLINAFSIDITWYYMLRVVPGARARSNGVKLREGKCRLDLRKLPAGGDLFNCEIV